MLRQEKASPGKTSLRPAAVLPAGSTDARLIGETGQAAAPIVMQPVGLRSGWIPIDLSSSYPGERIPPRKCLSAKPADAEVRGALRQ